MFSDNPRVTDNLWFEEKPVKRCDKLKLSHMGIHRKPSFQGEGRVSFIVIILHKSGCRGELVVRIPANLAISKNA